VPELTVAAGLARGLIEVAVPKGAAEEALLARAGIAPAELDDQDNRIPFPKYVALMRAGKELCNDPALGLHFGELNDLARVSVVGLIGYASDTMLEAIEQMNRYGRLVIEFDGGPDRFRIAQQQRGLWLVDNRANANAFHELTESTFARLICGARRIGQQPMVKQIHVTHPDPGYADEYDRIFGVPVAFGAEWNAMEIDPAVLSFRLNLQPRYVFGILTEHADALLKELENSKSLRGRVENLLMPIMHKGDIGIEAIAAKLGMSRQTLFRKLKAEGITFEKLLDDLRHRLALGYLRGKKVSVNEVAYLVGFSDPAAFSRAFRRWTGSSPRAWRERDKPG
jgi:AraC-like DNA-binding protein